jgi:hypothetical protein
MSIKRILLWIFVIILILTILKYISDNFKQNTVEGYKVNKNCKKNGVLANSASECCSGAYNTNSKKCGM